MLRGLVKLKESQNPSGSSLNSAFLCVSVCVFFVGGGGLHVPHPPPPKKNLYRWVGGLLSGKSELFSDFGIFFTCQDLL